MGRGTDHACASGDDANLTRHAVTVGGLVQLSASGAGDSGDSAIVGRRAERKPEHPTEFLILRWRASAVRNLPRCALVRVQNVGYILPRKIRLVALIEGKDA